MGNIPEWVAKRQKELSDFRKSESQVKTTSNQLSDVIENYEEVVEKLSQTKYAKFLQD